MSHLVIGLFQFLEIIYQKKLLLGLAGLGLGFGFSLIVFQRPTAGLAMTWLTPDNPAGWVEKVTLPKFAVETSVNPGSLQSPACLVGKARQLNGSLTSSAEPMVIDGCSRLEVFGKLADLNLGDEIVLIGRNRGRYHYRVIAVRAVAAAALSSTIQENSTGLVLFTPTDLFATQFLMIIAKS